MSRIQLALRVPDLDGAVEFYSRLFHTAPAKRRPGYANFAVEQPPLKLVLVAGQPGTGTELDHLGIEVDSTTAVEQTAAELVQRGLTAQLQSGTTCCYAVQDKAWVTGPGDQTWEVYTVLDDHRVDLEGEHDPALTAIAGDGSCCSTDDAGVMSCC